MFTHIHRKIVATFSPLSKASLVSFNVVILLLLGWVDFITGDYSLIIFYLIPVSLAAWFIGRYYGILFCFIALVVRIVADESSLSSNFLHSNLHYWNELIEFLFLLIMSLLFSALKKNLENEKTLASHDPLTGALNRRSFFDLAEYEINRSRRYALPFTAVYIDLDNFKDVNDSLGHRTGDEVLIAVVSTIRANIRSTDILARFGGDEFAILLPETSGKAAITYLDKMYDHLNDAVAQNKWPITFSIGAATYNEAPESIDLVVQQVDELMYSVKRSSKNRLLHREFGGAPMAKGSFDATGLIAPLMVRIPLGLIFMAHGSQKLLGLFGGHGLTATFKSFEENMGIPPIFTLLAIIAEFGGGFCILSGFLTRLSAAGIATVMLVAIYKVHWVNGFFLNMDCVAGRGHGIEYNIALLGMALYLIIAGGGRWCLDRLVFKG